MNGLKRTETVLDNFSRRVKRTNCLEHSLVFSWNLFKRSTSISSFKFFLLLLFIIVNRSISPARRLLNIWINTKEHCVSNCQAWKLNSLSKISKHFSHSVFMKKYLYHLKSIFFLRWKFNLLKLIYINRKQIKNIFLLIFRLHFFLNLFLKLYSNCINTEFLRL